MAEEQASRFRSFAERNSSRFLTCTGREEDGQKQQKNAHRHCAHSRACLAYLCASALRPVRWSSSESV